MTLSQQEIDDLVKWIEYHLKGYENDQNPQILASYIKSLILRQASQQRMVAVLHDFMDEKAEDFVNLLEKHLKTKDFSIPELQGKEKNKTPATKKQETSFKVVIEEVKPENLISRPVISESTSSSQKKKTTSSKEKKDIIIKNDSRNEKDTWKSRDKNPSSISNQSTSQPKYTSSSQFEKKGTSSKPFSTKPKEKDKKSTHRDDKSKDKIKRREKEDKYSQSKDKHSKKSRRRRSPSPYTSTDYDDYDDYSEYEDDDYDNYDDFEDDYTSEYDYYSYVDSDQYDDEKEKKRPFPFSKFSNKNRIEKNQSSRFQRNYKNKDIDKSFENERRTPYFKKQKNQKKFKDFTSYQKNNRNDNASSSSTKHQNLNGDAQNDNMVTREPSEVERDHIFIIAVCGIPSQFNTIGHILKEFNRFGLIYGIQIVSEQKMALIEFADLESAYRAVNSRHLFFKNRTIKVDYAVQISQEMLDPIAEKIKQKKLIIENKKKERLLKKQRDLENRTNALAQAAAMAAAAINNINTEPVNLTINTDDSSDEEIKENEQLLLTTLSEKIDEYEKLENCERKEKLKKDIEELSSFLDYIS